jgi:hypothetical protein
LLNSKIGRDNSINPNHQTNIQILTFNCFLTYVSYSEYKVLTCEW